MIATLFALDKQWPLPVLCYKLISLQTIKDSYTLLRTADLRGTQMCTIMIMLIYKLY